MVWVPPKLALKSFGQDHFTTGPEGAEEEEGWLARHSTIRTGGKGGDRAASSAQAVVGGRDGLGGKSSAARFGQGKLVDSTSFPSTRLLALRFAATVHQRPSKTAPSRFVAVSRRRQDVARQDFTLVSRRCCNVAMLSRQRCNVVATTLRCCRDNEKLVFLQKRTSTEILRQNPHPRPKPRRKNGHLDPAEQSSRGGRRSSGRDM